MIPRHPFCARGLLYMLRTHQWAKQAKNPALKELTVQWQKNRRGKRNTSKFCRTGKSTGAMEKPVQEEPLRKKRKKKKRVSAQGKPSYWRSSLTSPRGCPYRCVAWTWMVAPEQAGSTYRKLDGGSLWRWKAICFIHHTLYQLSSILGWLSFMLGNRSPNGQWNPLSVKPDY